MLNLHPAKIKRIIIGLCAAALATPLIAWQGLALDYTLFRSLAFFFIVELALVFYFLLLTRDNSYFPKLSHISGVVGALIAIHAVSLIFSIDTARSFWGTWQRSMDSGFLAIMHYTAFFFLLSAVIRKREEWYALIKFGLVVASLVALAGAYQFINPPLLPPIDPFGDESFGRIAGTLANPITLATYLGFYLMFALYVWSNKSFGSGWRKFALFAVALFAVVILGSASRGPLLGLIAVLGLLGIYALTVNREMRKMFGALLIIGVLAAGALSLVDFGSAGNPIERLTTISLSDSSLINRLETWKVALVGIADRPLFGWGQEGFTYLFDQNYNPEFLTSNTAETWWDRGHNLYIDVAATTGMVGMTFYIALILVAFVLALRRNIFLAGIFVFYAVSGLTFFDVNVTYVMLFFLLAFVNFSAGGDNYHSSMSGGARRAFNVAIERAYDAIRVLRERYLPSFVTYGASVMVFVMLALVILSGYIFSQIALANYRMNAVGDVEYRDAIELFKDSLSVSIPGTFTDEVRYEAALYVVNAYTFGVLPEGHDRADFAFTKGEIEKAFSNHPRDARIGWMATRLNNFYYTVSGDESLLEDAEVIGWRAALNSPGRQQIFFEQAQIKINQGKLDEALVRLREIVYLNPNFPGAYFTLGIGYLLIDNAEKGIANIELAQSLGYDYESADIPNWLYIAGAYNKRDEFGKMIDIYLGLIEIQPFRTDYRKFLAVSYAQANMFDEAEAAALTILGIDESLEREVSDFLSDLKVMRSQYEGGALQIQ